MKEDPYQSPLQTPVTQQEPPSRRTIQCAVAWVSGFLSLPAVYFGLRLALPSRVGSNPVPNFTLQDLTAFAVAGTVAAIAVAPFRRIRLWLAVLAGLIPVVLFTVLAVGILFYRLTA